MLKLNKKENGRVLFQGEGIVREGKQDGRKLGFPTANISCSASLPSGIYAGEVMWKDEVYPAALYKEVGRDYTEAHLLDFSGNLYGETLAFHAYQKIRGVKVFTNQEALIRAIAKDIADIKQLCSQGSLPQ